MARIASERRDASTARVPAVLPGTVIVFTRYDVEKAVVLSPPDFHRLSALDEDLDELATDRIEPGELALRALGERIVRCDGLDTRALLERQIRELVARRRTRGEQRRAAATASVGCDGGVVGCANGVRRVPD